MRQVVVANGDFCVAQFCILWGESREVIEVDDVGIVGLDEFSG